MTSPSAGTVTVTDDDDDDDDEDDDGRVVVVLVSVEFVLARDLVPRTRQRTRMFPRSCCRCSWARRRAIRSESHCSLAMRAAVRSTSTFASSRSRYWIRCSRTLASDSASRITARSLTTSSRNVLASRMARTAVGSVSVGEEAEAEAEAARDRSRVLLATVATVSSPLVLLAPVFA